MHKKLFITAFLILFSSSLCASDKLSNVTIDGNKRVSDETIKVYGDIQIDEKIDEAKINNILKRLYETNFFEDVQIKFDNNILAIRVKEFPVINQLILIGEPNSRIKEQVRR